MTSKEYTLRNRVFHEKYCDKPKTFTLYHFAAEGVPCSTLFDILKRKEDGISSERQSGSGRPAKIMTKSGIKRLVKLFDHKCGISQRKAARKMKCSLPFINWALKNKTSIRKRKQRFHSEMSLRKKKFAQCLLLNFIINIKILLGFLTMSLT